MRLSGIEWYVYDEEIWRDGIRWVGVWSPGRIGIYRPFLEDEGTVKHELLHELLWQNGLQGAEVAHPAPWFPDCVAA